MAHSHSLTRLLAFVCWKNWAAAWTCVGRLVTGFLLFQPKNAWEHREKASGVRWASTTVMTRVTSRSGNAGTGHCSPWKAKNFTSKSDPMRQSPSPKPLGLTTSSQSLGHPAVLAQERTEVQFETFEEIWYVANRTQEESPSKLACMIIETRIHWFLKCQAASSFLVLCKV